MKCKSVTVSEVADVFNGKTPSKSEQRDIGHPVLKIKDVDENDIFRGRYSGFVDEELSNKHYKKQIVAGDTLILNAAQSITKIKDPLRKTLAGQRKPSHRGLLLYPVVILPALPYLGLCNIHFIYMIFHDKINLLNNMKLVKCFYCI